MLITRKAEFSASHVCRRGDWSDEQNRAVYGDESNPHGHGHNFVVEVTLEGDTHAVTGMVFDLKKLKDILSREVVAPFDHRFLNREVEPFDRVIPTPENIAAVIWQRVAPHFEGSEVRLHRVRLYEGEDLFVDCFGAQP